MPRIDVLPTSTSIPKAGYALVPDDTRRAQQVASQSTGRKRAARTSAISGGDNTVRQQNAVLKHLAELDKDTHKDVQIPVPSKQKENTGRGRIYVFRRWPNIDIMESTCSKVDAECSTHSYVTEDFCKPPGR